jgi:hypothetical protein
MILKAVNPLGPTAKIRSTRAEIRSLLAHRNNLMDDAFEASRSGAKARAATIQSEIIRLEEKISALWRSLE